MKNTRQFAYIAFLIAFAVNFLVACDSKTRGAGPSNAGGGSSPAPQSGGTSDSGGCNGVENRCFDSYIVDPITLPAYKNVVEPLLNNLQVSNPEHPADFRFFFKMKPWYLAPVDLAKLRKEALGVSFVKSDVQQIAIQNMKAIWIDKRIFDQMSEKDQADLLVHELVMGLYFVRFMHVKELCEISNLHAEKDKNQKCDIPPGFEKAFAPEKLRPLNDEDNERIRFVTAWLLQSAKKPIHDIDFVRVMHLKGFDRRLFNPENYKSDKQKLEALKLERKEILDAIKAAELTGFLPNICRDMNGADTKACAVSFRGDAVKLNKDFSLPALSLKIEMNGKEVGSVTSFINEKVDLAAGGGIGGNMTYILYMGDFREKFRVGDSISSAVLGFKYEGPEGRKQLVLKSIVFKKSILISIDLKHEQNICQTRTAKSKVAFDTGFIAYQDMKDDLMIEEMYLGVEAVALCSKDNIEQ